MKFDHYIAELLNTHDCVIIPDFGGFVGNQAPARINPINDRFDPPYRKISFNKLLTHNDGLLAAHVAKIEQDSFEIALDKLKDYSIYLKSTLRQDQKIEFDKIGILYQNSDGSLRFEQFSDALFSNSGFGLESFFGHKINRQIASPSIVEPKKELNPVFITPAPEPVQEPVKEKEQKEPTPVIPIAVETSAPSRNETKGRYRVLRAAAALLAIPILGYAIYLSVETPLFKSNQDFHYSDLNPFVEKVCPEYEPKMSNQFGSGLIKPSSIKELERKGYVDVYRSEARDKTLVVSLEEKVERVKDETILLPYHIIGGCFSDENNAKGMVSKYQNAGSNASVVGKVNNLYRVSVASFGTKKEAKQQLASVRNEIPNAWILYK